jgi:hypothetical protein
MVVCSCESNLQARNCASPTAKAGRRRIGLTASASGVASELRQLKPLGSNYVVPTSQKQLSELIPHREQLSPELDRVPREPPSPPAKKPRVLHKEVRAQGCDPRSLRAASSVRPKSSEAPSWGWRGSFVSEVPSVAELERRDRHLIQFVCERQSDPRLKGGHGDCSSTSEVH